MRQKSLKHFSAAEYDQQFKEWHKSTWKPKKAKLKPLSASTIARRIRAELLALKEMPAQEYERIKF